MGKPVAVLRAAGRAGRPQQPHGHRLRIRPLQQIRRSGRETCLILRGTGHFFSKFDVVAAPSAGSCPEEIARLGRVELCRGGTRSEATMTNPKRTTSIAGHPIHPMLIPFPIAFFVSAFVCDLAYWQTSNNKQRVGHSGTLAHWCGPRDGRTRRGGGPYRCLGRSMMPGGTREETSLSCLLKTQFLCSLLRRIICGAAERASLVACGRVHFIVHRLEGLGNGVSIPRRCR